jgi:tRNA-dihydrouridine synthase B
MTLSLSTPDESAVATLPNIRPLHIGPLLIDPPLLQAPMAGFTNYAYRQVVRQFGGVGLQATEMVSARGFVWMDRQEEPEAPDRLWGVADEPRPLAVQMWDNDPEILASVGQRLAQEYKVSVVDINFGCPVKDVAARAHSGSYLLRDPDRVGRIVERVVQACHPTPVTAKIRLGCTRDNITAIEIATTIESAGAAALTVHGRTAQDFFKGHADWQRIASIKPHLKRIPLIGNGDLDSPQAVLHALGRPWLFSQCAAALRGESIPPNPTLEEERDLLHYHYRLVCQRFGDERGTVLMRKFACCYAQGRSGARDFRASIARVSTPPEFLDAVEKFFPRESLAV